LELAVGATVGIIGDFNLDHGSAGTTRVGRVLNIRSGASAAKSCWRRLWLTGNLPSVELPVSVLIQLADKSGNYTFDPTGESVLIRALQVERGNTASEYGANP
jgi:hypothetical protein